LKTLIKIYFNIRQQFLLLAVFILFKTAAFAQLRADFSANTTSGCPSLQVTFKDNSTGNPTSWHWDLGNQTFSDLKNPSTIYSESGSYTVKLTVKNSNGTATTTKTDFIVVNAIPVAKFGSSYKGSCFPLNVQFIDSSLAGSGAITQWKWDFGDGTLSEEQNPRHTYTHAGSFPVVLTVTNSNNCRSAPTLKTAYINIQDGVKADFSYESPKGCTAPASVNFTNKSVGTGVINYKWDFGDGNTSNGQNPVNNYRKAGSYTVKLIASNNSGCSDTMVKPNAVNIGFVKPDFTTPDPVCAGTGVQLKNTSSPSTFVSSSWDFGDGTFSDSANPVKNFATPGTYDVKLVTNFGSCQASVVKSVTVSSPPEVSFTAKNNTGCRAPLNVSFKNTTPGAFSYLWNFGDNTTSALQNPFHTYKKAGEYEVSLTVKNASKCYSTLRQPGLVKITPPKIASIKNLPLKGCIPSTATPVAVITNSTEGIKYLWDFGDGATSTDSTPSHTYTTPGNYNIKLTITTPAGCIDTLTVVKGAQVGTKPNSDFSADPLDVCANTPVNFKDLSSGSTANIWNWKFGDHGTSSEQNPLHIYSNAGKFSVTLIVSNFGCSDTLKKPDYINVRPPIAKFDTAFSCGEPLTRNFIDKSTGAKTWQWDFGDGSVSQDKKVTHTYAAPGIYSVTLKVTNKECEHTIKKDVVVIDEHGSLESSITEGCVNTNVNFKVANINEANIRYYGWLGDSLAQPVVTTTNFNTYVYKTSGVRRAAVAMLDKLKCVDTLYTATPISIYGPKAGFGSSNPETCVGNTVNFIDSSVTDGSHPIVGWTWDFGEGAAESYSTPPFSHNYSAPNNYNVTLIVKDTYGCSDTITKPSLISVTKPVARFIPSDSSLCPQSPITFNNYSDAIGATYEWKFGDGSISTDTTPVHSYTAPGIYIVTLRVVDKNRCSDSTSDTIKVSISTAGFSLSDSFSTCPPLVVNATNHSTNFSSFNWDFGDGGNSQLMNPSHTYTYPGIYTIKLLINSNGGCKDSLSKEVVIEGPTAAFNPSPKEACNKQTVNFALQSANTVSYLWDYNDGTTVLTDQSATSHTYTSPGTYVVKIRLRDANGCEAPMAEVDTITIDGIETNFNSPGKLLCDSGYITFEDSTVSNAIVNSWLWNFGDGASSSDQFPNHNFTDTGLYTITLVSKTEFGCADTAVRQDYIKVVSSPVVRITGDTAACEPAKMKFAGEFVKTDTSAVRWKWAFGNGKTSNVQNPGVQTYATAGTYRVTLKATNSSGCYDSVVQKTVIHPKPPVNAGADTAICKSNSITLHASGANGYTWTSDPSLSCTDCAAPTAKPDQTITYHLSGTSTFGCTNEDSITVTVQQPFKIDLNKNDTVCLGESIVLKATGADSYEWTPSTWLDNVKTGTPKSTPASSITYKVVGKDRLGCFKDEASVKLKVYPRPDIEITNGESVIVPAGGNVKLLTKGSADIIKWKWYPPKWLNCDSCSEAVATGNDKITYQVTGTNIGHCEARDEVTVNVICNNANIYVPNTFSPNHDGSNDVFYPRGTGLYTIKSFKIFNRWGQVVFSKGAVNANDPQSGWDGTLNGALLQPDVYVYTLEVICSNNVTLPIKGNVTLIR
jgi:gliding motility-associated-like protein